MGECRGGGGDGLIKLFGTTIPVPEAADAKDLQCNGGVSSNNSSSSSAESDDDAKETTHQLDGSDPQPQPEVVDAEDPNKPTSLADDDKPGQQGKPPMKKPDKVLPCPRCNSMDTKFCYFNNYNVNQPRHFCKNCQRYWTAGGAMRHVPVGAGRRKNKSVAAASQFLQRVRAALPADPALLKAANGGGGTVLSFGHAEPPQQVATHHLAKEKPPLLVSVGSTTTTAGNSKSCSEGSRSSSTDDKNQSDKVEKPAASNGVVQQQQQHPAASMWPYYPPGIAIPIFPSAPAYWGCMVPAAGGWSLPWPMPPPTPPQQGSGFSSPTCSAAPSSLSSGAADYLTLGKHARDDEGGRSSHHGNVKVWAPKTIRIDDDADEVAKSSIWSLVGPKGRDKHNTSNIMHGLRKGSVFEPKHEMAKTAKQAMITSSPLLHANPVALTRSLTFQEGA